MTINWYLAQWLVGAITYIDSLHTSLNGYGDCDVIMPMDMDNAKPKDR